MRPKTEVYKAYKNAFKMILLREYHEIGGRNPVEPEQFDTLRASHSESRNWIHFQKTVDGVVKSMYLAVATGDVNKEVANAVVSEMANLGGPVEKSSRGQKKTTSKSAPIHLVFVLSDDKSFTSDAKKIFADISFATRRNIPRSQGVIPQSVVELAGIFSMQFNPMKFALQSKIVFITDEDMKEKLRQSLVRVMENKAAALDEILPFLSLEGPIARWYGAHVGDLFYFHRSLGGEQAYYRIVRPEMPGRDKGKAYKVKGEKSAEDI
uniref:Uncharacterized protein n=1 Tax=viral metagenome TaxID=1070528 RepID=A0A6C0CI06_9ZZZZ